MTPLHRAILAGRPAEVSYLLEERKCDPNSRDENLRTPLIACSLADRADMAEVCAAVLLNKGAKINLADRLGKDALCWACLNSKAKLVKMFLEDYPNQFQFNLRRRDRDGNTALHLAARTGNPDIVGLLLAAYADNNLFAEMNERNARGETPLHLAAKRGNSAAVLALLPVSSDALFSRRGAVDFRSAPKWASAAVKISKITGDQGVKHDRPFSLQHVGVNTPTARRRRPKTVTTTSSDFTRFPSNGHIGSATSSNTKGRMPILPRRTNISEIFKVSGVQLAASSAYRRPARAPPPVSEDDKNSRPRSSTHNKLPGKGRRGSVLANRGRASSRRESIPDGDVADKQQIKTCKAVPTVVIDEAVDASGVLVSRKGSGSFRLLAPGGDDSNLGRATKRSQTFNHSMSDIPESPVQGWTYLTPFEGPGTPFDVASRASSIQSLVSDLPGLLAHGPAFDRSETEPVITFDGPQAPPIRRTKSEPSLNYLDQLIVEPLVSGKNHGLRFEHKRSRGTTNRRRGHSKPRVADKDKTVQAANGKKTSRPPPIKLEAAGQAVKHADQPGDLSTPPVPPPSPAPPPRSGSRRFFRSGREAEITLQRRRTELERRIRSVQRDIDKLESRRKGRKYKSLIPEWVTVDEETTLEELVAAISNDKSGFKNSELETTVGLQLSPREAGGSGVNQSRDLRRTNSVSTELSSSTQHDAEPERGRYHSCSSSLDLDVEIQNVGRCQRLTNNHFSMGGKSPRLLRNNLRGTTLRIPQPAQAPVYKQSRSIFANHPAVHHLPKQQHAAKHLSNDDRDQSLQSRVGMMPNRGTGLRYKPARPKPAPLNINLHHTE